MLWILALSFADCPDFPVVLQTLSEDGAAWQLREDQGIQCLYRIDDQDESTLIKRWEGAPLRRLLPLTEGVLALTDRSALLLDGEGQRRIPLPSPAQQACYDAESGSLSLDFVEGRWVIQVSDGHVQTQHGPGCG